MSTSQSVEKVAPQFVPPLFRQRYKSVSELVSKLGKGTLNKVVDMGCSSFGLFNYLKSVKGIRELILMDIDYDTLKQYCYKIDPLPFEFIQKRNNPLAVSVLCADARYVHAPLRDTDVVLMVEFIEHLELNDLSAVVESVFSGIVPKLVVMTTPNRDFNKFFPTLREGTFRHSDHKFEFTQIEFEEWCKDIVSKVPFYDVSFTGCGGPFEGILCTQTAIFVRNKIPLTPLDPKIPNPLSDGRYDKLRSAHRPCHKSCGGEELCHVIRAVEYPWDKRTSEERQTDAVKKSWLDFGLFLRKCLDKVYEIQSEKNASDKSSDQKANASLDEEPDSGIIYSKQLNQFSFNVINRLPKWKKGSKDDVETPKVEVKTIFVKFVTDEQSIEKIFKSQGNNILFCNEYEEKFYIPSQTFRLWAGLNTKIKKIEEVFDDMNVKKIAVNERLLYIVGLGRDSDDESDINDVEE